MAAVVTKRMIDDVNYLLEQQAAHGLVALLDGVPQRPSYETRDGITPTPRALIMKRVCRPGCTKHRPKH